MYFHSIVNGYGEAPGCMWMVRVSSPYDPSPLNDGHSPSSSQQNMLSFMSYYGLFCM